MNPLQQLAEFGQSPWLDFVRRSLIEKGELSAMIVNDGLKGVTSNPSIFQKAIGDSAEYDDDLKQFQSSGDHGISAIYDHLTIADIRAAADALEPVYAATHARDGYISLEVSPYLGHDTELTAGEAERLWKTVGKPNLMVKIPATVEGIPSIRSTIAKGINVNVTLLFSIAAYEAVVEAYISGLEQLVAGGGDPSRVGSVASFFVSRIDALVDKRIEAAIKGGAPESKFEGLHATVAIANARLAYQRYKVLFSGERWQKLAARGAKTQRLLWASTSTKSKSLPDTLYIDQLIGRDTVNTIPPATMDAFRDHGHAVADTIEHDIDGARATMAKLEAAGISMDALTAELVEDGVKQFSDAFDSLLGTVAKRRRTLFEGEGAPGQTITLPDAIKHEWEALTEAWRKDGTVRRMWRPDATVWTNKDEAKWTGWLHVVEHERADLSWVEALNHTMESAGITDVLLLGMGGSSLGPEVLARTLKGKRRFAMLDSTDPTQIRAVERSVDLAHTLVIVSSKSGSTLEPNIFMEYFLGRVRSAIGDKAASHFVAVTDPGSSLDKQARSLGFAHVLHGDPTIGGRYSVLSKFGLVPAAAIGIDVKAMLDAAAEMVRACADDVPPAENPGVLLGLAMGAAAKAGRDKVTIVASPGIDDFGAWAEQLIAESTGKQGRGLIPVAGEPLAAPDHYGDDRVFAYLELRDEADARVHAELDALEAAGHPVVRITVREPVDVAQEFFRWEVATAVAGSVIGIDPFDQPDVEASKIATRKLTDEYAETGKLATHTPMFSGNGVSVYADAGEAGKLGGANDLVSALKAWVAQVKPGDYIALLAYLPHDAAHEDTVQRIRVALRDHTKAATVTGFGPRFQHSTGQAYKGGPNSGVFMQITCDDPEDLAIPGQKFSFGIVKAAQAQGDLDVLVERGRRCIRVHLQDGQKGLATLGHALEQALGKGHS